MRTASALVLLVALAGCRDAEKCRMWAGGTGISTWAQCGDAKERTVACKGATCTCAVDGAGGRHFETTDPHALGDSKASSTAIANEQCGWHLR